MKQLIALLVFVAGSSALAQYEPSPKDPKPKLSAEDLEESEDNGEDLMILKLSPLDIVSAPPIIGADVEFQKGGQRMSYQLGAGILPNYYFQTGVAFGPNVTTIGGTGKVFDRMIGGMVRGEARGYLKENKVSYFSGGLSLDYRYIQNEMTIGMEPDQGDELPEEAEQIIDVFNIPIFGNIGNPTTYAYFQKQDMKFHRITFGVSLNYGQNRVFNNGFEFEWFVGGRLNVAQTMSNSTIPENGEVIGANNRLGWNLQPGRLNIYPALSSGIRVGFAFKQRDRRW
ncbi:MAG: hypothetical protein MI810_14755 [Flavobacteriales bacterium]|nr:hypothetical protein [Flavobacteriales bacterium]